MIDKNPGAPVGNQNRAGKRTHRPYRNKPGREPIPVEKRRLLFSISLANKPENGQLLDRFRKAAEQKEGEMLSREQLIEIAKTVAYNAIEIYCEKIEQEQGGIFL